MPINRFSIIVEYIIFVYLFFCIFIFETNINFKAFFLFSFYNSFFKNKIQWNHLFTHNYQGFEQETFKAMELDGTKLNSKLNPKRMIKFIDHTRNIYEIHP